MPFRVLFPATSFAIWCLLFSVNSFGSSSLASRKCAAIVLRLLPYIENSRVPLTSREARKLVGLLRVDAQERSAIGQAIVDVESFLSRTGTTEVLTPFSSDELTELLHQELEKLKPGFLSSEDPLLLALAHKLTTNNDFTLTKPRLDSWVTRSIAKQEENHYEEQDLIESAFFSVYQLTWQRNADRNSSPPRPIAEGDTFESVLRDRITERLAALEEARLQTQDRDRQRGLTPLTAPTTQKDLLHSRLEAMQACFAEDSDVSFNDFSRWFEKQPPLSQEIIHDILTRMQGGRVSPDRSLLQVFYELREHRRIPLMQITPRDTEGRVMCAYIDGKPVVLAFGHSDRRRRLLSQSAERYLMLSGPK